MMPAEEEHDRDIPEPDDFPEDEADFSADAGAPGRLVDELVDYVRTRRAARSEKPLAPVDEERLLRTVLDHLRRNPIPTGLLAFSLTWLMLSRADEEEVEVIQSESVEPLAYQIEEEILQQVEGGFSYTRQRLRELVDRYPWGAAAAMVGGGLLAALLLPERRRQARATYFEHEIGEEPVAGEGFEFEAPEEEDEPFR
jgi:hypothetical protein